MRRCTMRCSGRASACGRSSRSSPPKGSPCRASAPELARITRFGHLFGQVFQITDDILDEVGDFATLGKPRGSDRKNGKATYVRLTSLARSRAIADRLAKQATRELDALPGRRL